MGDDFGLKCCDKHVVFAEKQHDESAIRFFLQFVVLFIQGSWSESLGYWCSHLDKVG